MFVEEGEYEMQKWEKKKKKEKEQLFMLLSLYCTCIKDRKLRNKEK